MQGVRAEASAAPPMIHISPVPCPSGGGSRQDEYDEYQDAASGMRGPSTPPHTPSGKMPKRNEQEMNDDFDRSFQIDAEALVLKHPLANGEGGIGEVWVGEYRDDNGTTHDVAVKRYPSAFGPEEMKMFRRETAVLFLAAMRCHNVCKVYGTAAKEGKLCIVMKLYKESMRGLLLRSEGHKLSLDKVQRYGGDICKAIAELHEQNIILQDLKPPNILLDEYDHCVLADFGISRFVQGSNPLMPSHVQGTFNYMSPEAFDPEQFGGITSRADSWSFACTLLEMLTGDQPWKDMKMAPICFKVMQRQTPNIPAGLPPALEQMLRSCFSFEPPNRPTFKQMYDVFRGDWAPKENSTAEHQGSRREQDPLGLGPILDAFRSFGPEDTPNPPPRVSRFGRQASASGSPSLTGRPTSTSSEINGEKLSAEEREGMRDSSLAGLYKRAAEADEAKKEAELARRELMDLRSQVNVLREEHEHSDDRVKDAIASKEELAIQLSKVMKVCQELRSEREVLSHQLLDLQEQLMSQEQKMGEERGLRQNADAAKKNMEEQFAKISVKYQEAVRQSSDSVKKENTELNEMVQNLVRKLNETTQELIEVTEERDKVADANEILGREKNELSKAKVVLQDEYDDMRATLEEMRDVHRYELEQAKLEHDSAATTAHRMVSQEKEAANHKYRELEAKLSAKVREADAARSRIESSLRSMTEDKELLDRRLTQSSLENVKLKEQYDRVVAERDELEEKNKCMSSALDFGEYQRLLKQADRYEKERAQWQRDRDSLQGCLKEMEEMGGRLSEADRRAHALASEKRQLEASRLRTLDESEVERKRFETALAKQRLEYEKRISDLEQAYERLKVNRDSSSTSDDTLVTERSMRNSLEMKGDNFSTTSIDIKADAYDKYHEMFYGKADAVEEKADHVSSRTHTDAPSPNSPVHSDSSSGDMRGSEEGESQLRSTMDEDRVKRVLHQLAVECDRHSNPVTPTLQMHSNQVVQRHPTSFRAAPPSAVLHVSNLKSDDHQRKSESLHSSLDAPSSPPPTMTLGGGGSGSAITPEDTVLSCTSSGTPQPRVLTTRRRLEDGYLSPRGRDEGARDDAPDHRNAAPAESGGGGGSSKKIDAFHAGSGTRGHSDSASAGRRQDKNGDLREGGQERGSRPEGTRPDTSGCNGRQTWDGRLEASRLQPSSAPSTPAKTMTPNDRRHSGHVDQQSSIPAASRSWQSQPIQPKQKGLSLGLMLEGTRVARVMRGSPAHAAGLKPDDLVKRVNGIRVTKEDVGKILRMQWLGGAEPLDLVADRGNETVHVVVQPEDVEISNGSPPSNVRAQTDRDAALAWQIHENDAALLAVESEASASSVTC